MRTKFLIKPRMQLKHLAWTLGTVIFCSLVGYILFETILRSSLMSRMVGPDDWISIRNMLRGGFGLVLLILTIAVGIENYLLFHSIVGPIYALEKGLAQVAEGNLDHEVKIRNYDQLADVIGAFENMKMTLRKKLYPQKMTTQFLTQELDRLLSDPTVENIQLARQKLLELQRHVETPRT